VVLHHSSGSALPASDLAAFGAKLKTLPGVGAVAPPKLSADRAIAPAPSAPPGCSPRSATAAPDSPPPNRWPAWPESPSTRKSGKAKVIAFRWAVDKQLRDAICDFAGDSRRASPWAASLYNQAIARGKDHPYAVRILARAWLYVIWHCWQDGIPYDPASHNAIQGILSQQDPAAA
jgi:hypothetical protein